MAHPEIRRGFRPDVWPVGLASAVLHHAPDFGPSNERDTVGLAADTAANPLLYIAPYSFVADDPLTYLGLTRISPTR